VATSLACYIYGRVSETAERSAALFWADLIFFGKDHEVSSFEIVLSARILIGGFFSREDALPPLIYIRCERLAGIGDQPPCMGPYLLRMMTSNGTDIDQRKIKPRVELNCGLQHSYKSSPNFEEPENVGKSAKKFVSHSTSLSSTQ